MIQGRGLSVAVAVLSAAGTLSITACGAPMERGVAWKFDGGCIAANPTVAGDGLAVGSCSGTFYLLDRSTGGVRWSYDAKKDAPGAAFNADPLVLDDVIVAGSDAAGKGYLYALDRTSGAVRWKHEAGADPNGRGGVRSEARRLGPSLYATTLAGQLVCLDAQSGSVTWSFQGTEPHAPAVAADRVFVTGPEGKVQALAAATGEVIWQKELGAGATSGLAAAGDFLYVGTRNRLHRLSQQTGDVTDDMSVAGSPTRIVISDGVPVFFVDKGGEPDQAEVLIGPDPELTKLRWARNAPAEWPAMHPAPWQGMVLLGDRAGEVIAYQVSDGTKAWSHKLSGSIRAIGADEGVLYLGTSEGSVLAFSPQQAAR